MMNDANRDLALWKRFYKFSPARRELLRSALLSLDRPRDTEDDRDHADYLDRLEALIVAVEVTQEAAKA